MKASFFSPPIFLHLPVTVRFINIVLLWSSWRYAENFRANYQNDRWNGSVLRRNEGLPWWYSQRVTLYVWSCDRYLAELLLRSGPVHQRTLNLNRWQQSQAHPAEFICYFCLRVSQAVRLVQLLPKTQDILNPSLFLGTAPVELRTELMEAWM